MYLQMMTILATLLARFEVHLAPRMGSWDSVSARTVVQMTISVGDGIWLKFRPR